MALGGTFVGGIYVHAVVARRICLSEYNSRYESTPYLVCCTRLNNAKNAIKYVMDPQK